MSAFGMILSSRRGTSGVTNEEGQCGVARLTASSADHATTVASLESSPMVSSTALNVAECSLRRC